jgi:autotransporter-associated beta strand protein
VNSGVSGGVITSSTGSGGIVSNSNYASVYSGQITGNVSFAKSGVSTLTLLADNTYRGATLLTGGGITLSDYGSLSATSGVSLNFGTLTLERQEREPGPERPCFGCGPQFG